MSVDAGMVYPTQYCTGRCSGPPRTRSQIIDEAGTRTKGGVGNGVTGGYGAGRSECGQPWNKFGSDCRTRVRPSLRETPLLFTRERMRQGVTSAETFGVGLQTHVCVQIQQDSSRERRVPLADDEMGDGCGLGEWSCGGQTFPLP